MMDKGKLSDDIRLDLLDVLDKLMQEHPGWRIGQLVTNMAFIARQTDTATWDVENEEFVETARQHLQRMSERSKAMAQAKQETAVTRQKVAV